jgi:hypothetical protein
MITPSTENAAIGMASFFKCTTSIWIAPANNKKLNMIFINADSKSTDWTSRIGF